MEHEMEDLPPDNYLKWAEEIARQLTGKYGEEEYEPGDREEFDIADELVRFLRRVIEESDRDLGEPVKVDIENDPERRHVVKAEGDPGIIVAIHDPMEGVVGAESISGADILVETIDSLDGHNLILTQIKRSDERKSGVFPKQFFGFGTMYMFGQYLVEGRKPWVDRFGTGLKYANRYEMPHNEFIFLKYIPEDLYLPLSTILSTQEFDGVTTMIDVSSEVISRQTMEMFADLKEGEADYYQGFAAFSDAFIRGEIGLLHPGSTHKTGFKSEANYRIADMNRHIGVTFLEVERANLDDVAAHMSNTGQVGSI